MVIICSYCNESCNRAKGYVSCVLCSKKYHIDCANKVNPKLTKTMLEDISKSNGGLVFRCGDCTNDPPTKTNSDVSELLLRFTALENQIQGLKEQVTKDVIGQLTEIKGDLVSCTSKMAKFEEITNSKLNSLEMENNFLHRQLNRPDIIIRGIPSSDVSNEQMMSAVVNIGKKYCDNFENSDINFCSFINRRKAILLKINNIHKRDCIMMNYRSVLKNKDVPNLKVSDVMDSDLNSRIFLDDNCTPLESKLRYVCRDLRRKGIINGYKIFYKRSYKVNVFLKDGAEKELLAERIVAYADKHLSREDLLS